MNFNLYTGNESRVMFNFFSNSPYTRSMIVKISAAFCLFLRHIIKVHKHKSSLIPNVVKKQCVLIIQLLEDSTTVNKRHVSCLVNDIFVDLIFVLKTAP
jgi:hypothetical protein